MDANNVITISGFIGSAKTKQVGENTVVNFSVATNNGKDKEGNNLEPTWHNCSCWNGSAEFFNKWFGVGKPISIVGKQEHKKITSDDGSTTFFSNIAVSAMGFVPSKRDDSSSDQQAAAPAQTTPAAPAAPANPFAQ